MLGGSSSLRTAMYMNAGKRIWPLWEALYPEPACGISFPSEDGKMMFRGLDKPWWGNDPEFSGKPFWGHFSLALKCVIMFHT